MKKLIIILSIGVFGWTTSCKQEKKTETEPSQMQHVMTIHDEVMPKMGALNKLISQLKSKVDTTALGMKNEKAMKDLQEASKAMMDWMVGFGNRFDSDEIMNGKALTPEKQQWLDEEEVKIKEVRDKINGSITNAEELLGGIR
ncbi:MAG: hypothetical protein WBG90_20110 [Saonia sp.]